ncbi:MAG: TOBE domain-containing protein, partial [Anaerolineae bacterium]
PPMNFIEVQFDPAARVLTGPGLQYPLGPRWLDHLKGRSAGKLILGVRPESITVAVAPSAGMVPASVYVMEQLGREILLDVKIGPQTIRAFVPADMRLRPGQDVWLQFHEDVIYLFDPESEVSLSWKE